MDLVISSMGMITSVGRDVIQSCASIRAGISRPHEIDYFEIVDPEALDTVPLLGHPIHGYTEGFNLIGLWIRLGKGCIYDLIRQGNLPAKSNARFWQKTALIGVTPYINDDRFQSDGDETPDLIKEAYLYPLMQDLGLPIPVSNLHAVCIGHAGTIAAIEMADRLIFSSSVERVIVLAVDSYLDTLTLEWLVQYKRLKSAANPTGLVPGEAGACFLLETRDACKSRNISFHAVVDSVGLDKEADHFFSGQISRGMGLSRAIEQTLSNASLELPFAGDLISDANGENWRANELAGARMRVFHKINSDSPLVLPCSSIGEVGAASGGVSLCVAVQSFARLYSHGERALILTSSEHGDVGAACLRKVR